VGQRYKTAREFGADLKHLKEELEFAARLKGHAGSQGDILTMKVGSATGVAEQTTFATRAVVGRATSRYAVLRILRLRYGKFLVLAAFILALIAAIYWRQMLSPRDTAIDSIAVLPFVNVGADPQMEYLPDGITENLIGSLMQLPSLRRVMSRSIVLT